MEETSEELPNFSIGIDLLGPDPTSNKNKAEKNSQVARFTNLSEGWTLFWTIKTLDNFGSLTFKTFFSDTSSFGFDLLHFPRKFKLFIHSYRLTGSNVFARTKG